jgi:hypothetical protein
MNEKTTLTLSDAIFSPCRTYRYILRREKQPTGKQIMFIGLNPSTADEINNDPTVTRCIMRAWEYGFQRFVMANIFGYRSTNPKGLRSVADPVGLENLSYILSYAKQVDQVVAAWGNHGLYLEHGSKVRSMLQHEGVPLYHLGITKANQPKHPLYIGYQVKPKRWE